MECLFEPALSFSKEGEVKGSGVVLEKVEGMDIENKESYFSDFCRSNCPSCQNIVREEMRTVFDETVQFVQKRLKKQKK